ncbi:MAG: branched-chain amino acid ABC transporter permease [Rhodoferax sp.]|uniref:branched-chain amino acid ABC transporter permease n=1 Tax=Rhodoferax sp. TaxID=50421 RepID=UPI0026399E79|nr:branched-chain amino acid ABC transporter permease [Rhodoferax sp.]MDD5333264.1 branched-chain amino acid ABC transporter permease [Rhodoferax sp.]
MDAYLLAVATVVLIYVLLAIGLNLQYGETGLINFGHVAFFALGAYTSALLALRGWPLPLSFLAAAAVAALAAVPLGLAALRLSEDYLAIVTLGFSETVRLVIQQEEWLTRGVQGLPGIPGLYTGLSGSWRAWAIFLTLLALTAAAALAVSLLQRSPFGRMLRAIRDNEAAVLALGKDPAGFKIRVFMVGAALAGLAGAFYAHFITFITPEQFIPLVTFYVWMSIILGGIGSLRGALVGTALLVFFLEGSRFLRDLLPGIAEVQMANVRLALIGLALVLFVLYRPQGMFGKRLP